MSSIDTLLSAFSSIRFFGAGVNDDDVVDRLNHKMMPGMLFALSVFTLLKVYMGNPVHCWIPPEYDEDHYKDYVNSYCWVHRMYSMPMEDAIPTDTEDRYDNSLGYYRWVTVFFMAQALMFKFPRIIWNSLKSVFCSHWDMINGQALKAAAMSGDERREPVREEARLIDLWLNSRNVRTTNPMKRVLNQARWKLIASYLIVKLIYITNICVQIWIISVFLKVNFLDFGASAFKAYFFEGRWENIDNFPRIALCDFQIRQMTNVQGFTVQCVLSLNLFLEKMFLVVWFLFLILFIANCISFLKWSWMFINMRENSKKYLCYSSFTDLKSENDRQKYQKFFKSFLGIDGFFLIKTIANNTSDMHVNELLHAIFLNYQKH